MKVLISILWHRAPDAEGVSQHTRVHDIPLGDGSNAYLFSAISNVLADDLRECEGGRIVSHTITKL